MKKKNLANTKTLSTTTDNFTSTYFEHPKNEKNASANEKKKRRRLTKRKNRKRRKIITKRLQIGTARTEIIIIKQMSIFLATASLKN